jgi:hypothetical protein
MKTGGNCFVTHSLPPPTRLCHIGGRPLRYTSPRMSKIAVCALSYSGKYHSIRCEKQNLLKSPCPSASVTSPGESSSVLSRKQISSRGHKIAQNGSSVCSLRALSGPGFKQIQENTPRLAPATSGIATMLLQFAVALSARADDIVDLQDERFVSTEYDPVVAIVFAFIVLCLLIVTAGVRRRNPQFQTPKIA